MRGVRCSLGIRLSSIELHRDVKLARFDGCDALTRVRLTLLLHSKSKIGGRHHGKCEYAVLKRHFWVMALPLPNSE